MNLTERLRYHVTGDIERGEAEPIIEQPTGRTLYDRDVARRPNYHDGTPRKQWDELSDIARWSWNRPQTRFPDAPDDLNLP